MKTKWLIKRTYLSGPRKGETEFLKKGLKVVENHSWLSEDETYSDLPSVKRVIGKLELKNKSAIEFREKYFSVEGVGEKEEYQPWPVKFN